MTGPGKCRGGELAAAKSEVRERASIAADIVLYSPINDRFQVDLL